MAAPVTDARLRLRVALGSVVAQTYPASGDLNPRWRGFFVVDFLSDRSNCSTCSDINETKSEQLRICLVADQFSMLKKFAPDV